MVSDVPTAPDVPTVPGVPAAPCVPGIPGIPVTSGVPRQLGYLVRRVVEVLTTVTLYINVLNCYYFNT